MGVKLGAWIHNQREAYSKGQLSKERTRRLEELGFVWEPYGAAWVENFGFLVQCRGEMGDCLVPRAYGIAEGVELGAWVHIQRTAYLTGQLSKERTKRLKEHRFLWGPHDAARGGGLGFLFSIVARRAIAWCRMLTGLPGASSLGCGLPPRGRITRRASCARSA